MLIPLIIVFILVVRVKIISNEYDVDKTVPMLISAGPFIIFALLSAGLIRVREDQIAIGIIVSILMYVAVAGALYGLALIWIKQCHRKKNMPDAEKTEGKK